MDDEEFEELIKIDSNQGNVHEKTRDLMTNISTMVPFRLNEEKYMF